MVREFVLSLPNSYRFYQKTHRYVKDPEIPNTFELVTGTLLNYLLQYEAELNIEHAVDEYIDLVYNETSYTNDPRSLARHVSILQHVGVEVTDKLILWQLDRDRHRQYHSMRIRPVARPFDLHVKTYYRES